MPDFFNIEDDIKFIKKYPRETQAAIKIRAWALQVIQTIGGRAIHPIACEVGGFKVLPAKAELENLAKQYESILKSCLILAQLVIKIKFPAFKRETRFISLTNSKEYGLFDGHIKISASANAKEKIIKDRDYLKNIEEIEEPYRAAKSAQLAGEPFMVGAIARINNNRQELNPLAKGILKGLKWKFPQYNSFENITAQAIEVVHAVEEAHKLLKDLSKNLKPEASQGQKLNLISQANPLGRSVTGIDAIEAPRGTLYHSYTVDRNGYLTDCAIITPTVCFLKNLEEDIKVYIPNILKLSEKQRSIKIRSLIRAYDPCISCATH